MSEPCLYDIMPDEPRPLAAGAKKLGGIVKMAIDTVKDQFWALREITASDEFLTGVATHLTYNQQAWAHIPEGNLFYEQMVLDIRDTCPKMTENPRVFLNITYRWVLVVYDNHVLPLIFLHKGLHTSLYRIVLAKNSRWLPVFYDKLQEIYLKGPDRPQEISFEPDTRMVSGPDLAPEWKVGGVYFGDNMDTTR